MKPMRRLAYTHPELREENLKHVMRRVLIDFEWLPPWGHEATPEQLVDRDVHWIWRGAFFTRGDSKWPRIQLRSVNIRFDEYGHRAIWQLYNGILQEDERLTRNLTVCTQPLCVSHWHHKMFKI